MPGSLGHVTCRESNADRQEMVHGNTGRLF